MKEIHRKIEKDTIFINYYVKALAVSDIYLHPQIL